VDVIWRTQYKVCIFWLLFHELISFGKMPVARQTPGYWHE